MGVNRSVDRRVTMVEPTMFIGFGLMYARGTGLASSANP